jgi:hypothetical protein
MMYTWDGMPLPWQAEDAIEEARRARNTWRWQRSEYWRDQFLACLDDARRAITEKRDRDNWTKLPEYPLP